MNAHSNLTIPTATAAAAVMEFTDRMHPIHSRTVLALALLRAVDRLVNGTGGDGIHGQVREAIGEQVLELWAKISGQTDRLRGASVKR